MSTSLRPSPKNGTRPASTSTTNILTPRPTRRRYSACVHADRGGDQDDRVRAVHEHRAREDDILMDSQRHSGQRLADVLRLGQWLEEVASGHVEDIEAARVGRVNFFFLGRGGRGGPALSPYSLLSG